MLHQPGRSRRNGSWSSPGNRVSDGWAPLQASADRLRAQAVKSDWPLSRLARIEGRWGGPQHQRKPPGCMFESEVLTGYRRWCVAAAFFRPAHCPSRSEGSVRGEKMLGCGSVGDSCRRSGDCSGIGCPAPRSEKQPTELDQMVLIEGPCQDPFIKKGPNTFFPPVWCNLPARLTPGSRTNRLHPLAERQAPRTLRKTGITQSRPARALLTFESIYLFGV